VTTVSSTAAIDAVAEVAHRLLPEEGVITDRARLRTYECDGLAHYRVTPALVVVPEDASQLASVVRVSLCPSSREITSRRAPRLNRSLANVRRSVCGETAETFMPPRSGAT